MIPANNRLHGLEHCSTFLILEGVLEEVLFDNARALVIEHPAQTRAVVFFAKLLAFPDIGASNHVPALPIVLAPRGRRKNGIADVKKNAIADRTFASWEALEAHLARWEREIANARMHGTTGEVPLVRFGRDEASRLKSILAASSGRRRPYGRPRARRFARFPGRCRSRRR